MALVLYFLIEFKSFWITLGIIYPLKLILNVPFTNLSLPAVNSVAVVNESILALNLNLSGLPQYESDAYSTASITLFNYSI